MQVPKSGIPEGAKKRRMEMRDLPPRKNARGGITRNDPPLPIPPPGFIVTPEDEKGEKPSKT